MFFGCHLMWSSNHLYTKLCNHQNQQQLLRPGCCSLDVIDLGDMGFGVSPSTLYCTVLCIHSINIMLQPSFLLAGRGKEWPRFLSVLSTWFKSDFFAHSAPSCMISHNQLVFSSSPSYVRKVNICTKHLSNVDRTGGWRHFSWSFWVGLGGGRRRVFPAHSQWPLSAHTVQYLTWFRVNWVTVHGATTAHIVNLSCGGAMHMPCTTTAQAYNMSLWKWEIKEL